jgi:hypothetical protein
MRLPDWFGDLPPRKRVAAVLAATLFWTGAALVGAVRATSTQELQTHPTKAGLLAVAALVMVVGCLMLMVVQDREISIGIALVTLAILYAARAV